MSNVRNITNSWAFTEHALRLGLNLGYISGADSASRHGQWVSPRATWPTNVPCRSASAVQAQPYVQSWHVRLGTNPEPSEQRRGVRIKRSHFFVRRVARFDNGTKSLNANTELRRFIPILEDPDTSLQSQHKVKVSIEHMLRIIKKHPGIFVNTCLNEHVTNSFLTCFTI